MQAVARAAALIASVVSVGLATRYLGVAQYGVLTSAVVFVGLFQTLTELGIGSIVIRRVAEGTGDLRDLVSLSLGMAWVYAFPVAVIAATSGFLVYYGDTQRVLATLILSTGLAFSALASSYQPVFSVNVRFSAVALADIVSRLGTLLVTVVVVMSDSGLLALAAAQAVPPVVQYVITRTGARRLLRVGPSFDRARAWALLRESIPLTASIFVGVLYWRIDGVLLSLVSDDQQVGAYGLALPLAFNLAIVGPLFAEAAFSPIAQLLAADRSRALVAIRQGMRFLLMMAAPVAVLGVPLAGDLVTAIASDQFRDLTTVPLRWFFLAVAVGFFSQLVSDLLLLVGQQLFLLRISMFNLGVNVALNLALIPVFGAVGCGIALVVSETSGVLLAVLRLRRAGLPVNPLRDGAGLIIPVGLALLVCVATLHLPVVVPVVAAGVTYLVALLVLRVVTVGELRELGGRRGEGPIGANPG